MEYTVKASGRSVSASDLSHIKFLKEDVVSDVLQNIAVILSTPKGSVPLYRDFGLDCSFLDKPKPKAEMMMRVEIREAIEKWEPRARVIGIAFSEDITNPGASKATVEVEISDGQEP